jgi:hypothetical protein
MADDVKAIELWPCQYQTLCKVRSCTNKATIIAPSVDLPVT